MQTCGFVEKGLSINYLTAKWTVFDTADNMKRFCKVRCPMKFSTDSEICMMITLISGMLRVILMELKFHNFKLYLCQSFCVSDHKI